ncbi:hypothetical protein EAH81_06020 [Flavobacterium pectinovorum]|uniref:Uncharacterized protein n=2 Tax=Flavobacterium pectinovorum TaxID=29533 RepID=A0A502F1U0_9FLAO|nr:hypothetical protein EAH81_06020 [Flavobacterium pectinovorum]
MDRIINKLTDQLAQKPKTLFLIDSLGALLTAQFLFIILQNFSPYIGMPKTVLNLLWWAAVCFFFYSAFCFLFLKEKWAFFIRLVSIANALYCLLTLAFLFMHYKELTHLGLAYFIVETAIISVLVYIELKVSAKI